MAMDYNHSTDYRVWLYNPIQPDPAASTAIAVGLLSTIVLASMRMRFYLVVITSCGFCSFEQLVYERIMVVNIHKLGY